MHVKDIMTSPVLSVESDSPILQAIRIMLQRHISGLTVIDKEGRLVGIVTEGDFLRRAETGTQRRRPRWLEFLIGPGRDAAGLGSILHAVGAGTDMKYSERLDRVLDWFIGGQIRPGSNEHRRVRMFLISHICGPFLGHPITAFLYLKDPYPWPHVFVLGTSITLFWLLPPLVRLFTKHYTLLALLSVQNLIFAILWGSYHYGGASSPFLMWLLVVPLLAFFISGRTPGLASSSSCRSLAGSAPSTSPICWVMPAHPTSRSRAWWASASFRRCRRPCMCC